MKNLIFKSSFHEKLKMLAVLVVLITSVSQMWAGAGWWDDGGVVLTFSVNGTETTRTLNKTSQGGTTSLGTVTTAITLKGAKGNVWKSGGNICSVSMYYRVKNSGGTVVYDKSGSATALPYSSTSGSNQVWQKTDINDDLLNGGLAPGTYTFECWFTATGDENSTSGCGTTFWYSKNSSNYTYTFIVPSKNLTVAGAANGNTVSGSVTGITKGTAYTITATPTTGYTFSGWSATSGSSSITIANTTSATTTVTFNNYSNDATVTASFVAETTHDVTISYKCGSTTIKDATTESAVGVTTPRSITAPDIDGYLFSSWTKGSGITIKSGSTSTATISIVSGASNNTLTANYTAKTKVRLYYSNPSGWSRVFAYLWNSANTSDNNGWLTDEITANTYVYNCNTYYYYEYYKEDHPNWNRVIFSDETGGSGHQSADITFSNTTNNGQYYVGSSWVASPSAKWVLAHSIDDYSTSSHPLTCASATSGYVDVDLAANTSYQFKFVDVENSAWYGPATNTDITYTNKATAQTMSSTAGGGANQTMTTAGAGTYRFTWDITNKQVTVTYPTSYTVTFGYGTGGSAVTASGSVSGSIASGKYVTSGENVTFTQTPATGYTFKGWYTSASGSTTVTGMGVSDNVLENITANKTVYAQYTENSYSTTIAVSPSGTGTTSPAAGSQNIKQATGTSVSATANTNYVFTGWTATSGKITPTSSTTNPQTFKASSAGGTITANFADQWNVKGDQWDSWATYNGMPATGTANTFSKSFSLPAKTTYHFKVVKRANAGGSDVWYGVNNGKTLTRASNSVTGLEANGGENEYITFTTDAAGTYTITYLYNSNVNSMKVTVTYPTAYTVTFGKGTGGSTISATATNPSGAISSGDYVASGATVTFSQTAASGYTFKGWYTTVDGNTSAGVNGSGQLTINAAKTVYAQYTPNNYTVTFDATTNGGTCATASKTVTFAAAYGELPVATKEGADAFAGWFPTASGAATRVTEETIVETANDHTLYARFENTFKVTVRYMCDDVVLRAQTSTDASATSVAAAINAPDILGYRFVNWTGSNATFGDPNAASTTVLATAATTITANYEAVPMVYFKNNLGWDSVFVTFNAYFNSDYQNAPGNNGRPYYAMTRLGASDVYYCVIPSTYTDNNYASWAWNIAFDNANYNRRATADAHTGNMNAFYGSEFTGRSDFDPKATMFIPYNGDTETRNSGTFYKTGCWMKYNSTDPGYTIYANTYVSGSGGSAVGGTPASLTAEVAGGFEFKGKVYFPTANYSYGFMLHKEYEKNTNDLWYTNTGAIHSTTTSLPWHFYTDGASENGQRCEIHTEAIGDYEFTVSFGTGRPVVNVVYPVCVGDYKLIYKDLATWTPANGAHTASWSHPSRVIKAAANAVDTVSFYVAYGSSPSVGLYKCTAINATTGAETWTKQSDVSLTSITGTGIYNFKIEQNASKVATASFAGSYAGNYYIRTDASDGGWNNYKTSGANTMTYSEYSVSHGGDFGGYSHYFMRHVNSGSNIKFCVANDFSQCISDTMVSDDYVNEWIEVEANIRFMWYYANNKIGRAYVSGSSNVADRFLVLEGDEHLYAEDGKALTTAGGGKIDGLNDYEMKFFDDQNWIYETTVQANPQERVKLTAKFHDKTQYFYGAAGDHSSANTHQLIGGTGDDKYKIRVVYDFKTNRLVAAWLPDGNVTTDWSVDADVMIIRYHQEDAQQITFSGSGKLKDVQTVYGAMKFNKYRLNNQREEYPHGNLGISQYERDLFFISFPFDVKLNDVFGFGTYGRHWIIEYYDGWTRAQKGYWKDSPTNWKFVTKQMKDTFTLRANTGYVLALDLDELTMESSVWNYGVENVYLYFPSTATVDNIQATSKTVKIDTVGYQCKINRDTPHGDRRVKDSHWHLIGVPSYANAKHPTSSSWSTDTDLEQTIYYPDIDPADWTTAAPFVYVWDASRNKFDVNSSTSYTFKPMRSYLVQYARDTLQWKQVNTTIVSSAPRRAMFAQEPCDFRLELMQDEKVIDQAFISMRDDEEVTVEFDFNYDLSKMLYGAFTSKSNIYTFAGNEEVAANCLPFKDETTVIPVGVTVNEGEEGEYIFSIPEGTNGVGVTLVDNERQIRTNLALTDYMTYLAAGEYTERFVLEISPIEQTTTSVGVINGANGDAALNGEKVTGVCKKLIDGVLYIVKDGKVFDARGARVQ